MSDQNIMQETGSVRTLYRPVGVGELELIFVSGWKRFPPRLEWQPIFYPVLTEDYALQIARDWNTKDAASGYAGFVTEFGIDAVYAAQFSEHVVGGKTHRELWVPAEALDVFNTHIQDIIRVTAAFYGDHYDPLTEFEHNLEPTLKLLR